MSREVYVRYLPREFDDDLRRWAPPELSDSELYSLYRIAERIHADGYEAGHLRGRDEGRDSVGRPNINDVNDVREAFGKERK
jgi:hypothetical protein